MSGLTICVASYRRPILLQELLRSLNGQIWRDELALKVLIIDNDPGQSAKSIFELERVGFRWPLRYVYEPRPGISSARNAALQSVETEYLAFIDDDERADPNWIQQLYDTALQHQADVVFGPVHFIFPNSVSRVARSHSMFSVPALKNGAEVKCGATNNVLFNASKVLSLGVRFDDAYGLTGGEDTKFFHELYLAGCSMVWCCEAIVYEHLPEARVRAVGMIIRAFQGGQSFARIYLMDRRLYVRLLTAIVRLITLPFAIVFALIIAPVFQSAGFELITKMAGWLGQLSVLTGFRWFYKAYGS